MEVDKAASSGDGVNCGQAPTDVAVFVLAHAMGTEPGPSRAKHLSDFSLSWRRAEAVGAVTASFSVDRAKQGLGPGHTLSGGLC